MTTTPTSTTPAAPSSAPAPAGAPSASEAYERSLMERAAAESAPRTAAPATIDTKDLRAAMADPKYRADPAFKQKIDAEYIRRFAGQDGEQDGDDGVQVNPEDGFDTWDGDGLPDGDRREVVDVARAAGVPVNDVRSIMGALKSSGLPLDGKHTLDTARAALVARWGGETDANLDVVKRFLQDNPAIRDYVVQIGVANQPGVALALHAFASKQGATRESLQQLMRSEAYQNPASPDHRRVRDEVERGYAKLYGGSITPE